MKIWTVGNKNKLFSSFINDNIHQNLNFFILNIKKFKIKGYFILDEYLSSKNIKFLIIYLYSIQDGFAIEDRKYIFKNIDVSELLSLN